MGDLEFILLEGAEEKPVTFPCNWQPREKHRCLDLTTELRDGVYDHPFFVLIADGPWPSKITSFAVDITGSNWMRPLGVLDAQCRSLYYRWDSAPKISSCLGMKLRLKANHGERKRVLCDITASQSIPNQLENTEQLLAKLENTIPTSVKKKRKLTSPKTPNVATPSRSQANSATNRRLRLSERKKAQSLDDSIVNSPVSPPEVKQSPCTAVTARRKDRPSARWGHAMCPVGLNKLLLVGGQGSNQVISKDALWELNTDTLSWSPSQAEPILARPELRTGHTMTYDKVLDILYVYGGSKKVKWYNDVCILDMKNDKWSYVEVNGVAPTRSYHTSTLYRGEMFMFGGVYPNPNLEPDSCSNDLFIFNSASKSWYQPIVLGEKPKPRSGHSATLLGDKLVIFGGWDAPNCFNDLHILDLVLMDYTSPTVKGTAPSPRCWHAACALSDNQILIHGGYDGESATSDSFIFTLDTSTWEKVSLGAPSLLGTRAGHTVCRLSTPTGSKLFIFGGGDNEDNFFNDLQEIEIAS